METYLNLQSKLKDLATDEETIKKKIEETEVENAKQEELNTINEEEEQRTRAQAQQKYQNNPMFYSPQVHIGAKHTGKHIDLFGNTK